MRGDQLEDKGISIPGDCVCSLMRQTIRACVRRVYLFLWSTRTLPFLSLIRHPLLFSMLRAKNEGREGGQADRPTFLLQYQHYRSSANTIIGRRWSCKSVAIQALVVIRGEAESMSSLSILPSPCFTFVTRGVFRRFLPTS